MATASLTVTENGHFPGPGTRDLGVAWPPAWSAWPENLASSVARTVKDDHLPLCSASAGRPLLSLSLSKLFAPREGSNTGSHPTARTPFWKSLAEDACLDPRPPPPLRTQAQNSPKWARSGHLSQGKPKRSQSIHQVRSGHIRQFRHQRIDGKCA